MRLVNRSLVLFLPSVLLFPNTLLGEEVGKKENAYHPFPGWFTSLKVGAESQLDADINDGGEYKHNKIMVQVSESYFWDKNTSASLSLSYEQSDYGFSGGNNGSLAQLNPWNKVNTLTLSTPIRASLNTEWSAFVLPYIRFSGESNAQFEDSTTTGIIAAANYHFSDNLSIGTGLAISSQIEESASLFPLLLVNWDINDQLTLNLGSNRGAIQSPGLTVSYKANKKWLYTLGSYYEKSRFRLNKNGDIASGVGEYRAFPLLASATYQLNPGMKFMFVTGVKLGNELTLEDSDGDTLYSESVDPSLTAGISFALRL